jgi:nicotinate-nucleotide pyrophosphorylase (carboxylating)
MGKTTGATPAPPLTFSAPETEAARWLIDRALDEDLPRGDLTSTGLFGPGRIGGEGAWVEAAFVARAEGVLCGLPVVDAVLRRGGGIECAPAGADGERVTPGQEVLRLAGPAAPVLSLERIALNFLQRLSGIATQTRRFADAIEGTGAVLLDTRKTAPGWRVLEKYAVRAGGGTNHRASLSDAILLKDNHAVVLRALGRGGIRDWIAALRRTSPGAFLEVEVGGREELLEALDAGADAILLDNFTTPEILWAVETRRARGGSGPLLEASGGMVLGRIREVALTGVDRISVGALTHSAPALDLALDFKAAHAMKGKP